MDDYVTMIKESKDRRIMEILEETENFLRDIGIKIVENKGDIAKDNLEILKH